MIDATHPYAKEVTKILKSAWRGYAGSVFKTGQGSEETKESICVENMDEAIKVSGKNRRKYSGNNRKQGAGILYKTDGLRKPGICARSVYWPGGLIVKNLDSPDVISSVCRDRFLRK